MILRIKPDNSVHVYLRIVISVSLCQHASGLKLRACAHCGGSMRLPPVLRKYVHIYRTFSNWNYW